jgi:hypothetical protein
MSELDELAAAAARSNPAPAAPRKATVVDYRLPPPVTAHPSRWPARELFRVGFFGGLGLMSSVLAFWIAVSLLFFLLSFVGCAVIGGAASRSMQQPRPAPTFPFGS